MLYPKMGLGRMVLIAVACSVFIETNQYVFEKGIAQVDDVIHNTIGAMIGWGVGLLTITITKTTAGATNTLVVRRMDKKV